jgi:hypothetical protein
VTVPEFAASLRAERELEGAVRLGDAGTRMVESTNHRDLAHAVAIVVNAVFAEAREVPRAIRAEAGDDLTVLAGASDTLTTLAAGPRAPMARPVDFAKGGNGLKRLGGVRPRQSPRPRVDACRPSRHRGFRIPLVEATL